MANGDIYRRESGLRRLGRATRWATVGAVALTGVLSAAVAQALPGKSSGSAKQAPSTAGASQPTPTTAAPSSDAPAQAPTPPQTAPTYNAPSASQAPVVSGGS